ncbi:Ger(x)C family spore germination protein [Paenibacillus thalictri]|uniref:Ger(X)C family spore germination protein n=1 Tax=Paenibacillus thalictri TaxID=2527873 RepID=A0A4Q9DUU8_9BACL|nr:Ger(x)C family spore germination protein [Paenibacillus thalictri]TBL79483.1 Ger(x)C family spore germination protein [Paenibacillus thalictri]
MKPGFAVKAAILLCSVCCLSGCWGHKDINRRLLPIVLGVSEGKQEKYHVVLRIPVPGKEMIRSIEVEAETIGKAVDKIRADAEQSLDLLHTKLLLIDEPLARKGIRSILDYTIRSKELTPKALMAIVSGDFEQLMEDKRKTTVGTISFDFFSKEAGWTPRISIVHAWEAYRDIQSYTRDMAVPIISKGKDTLYHLEGSAIMQGDRMAAKISPDETIIYNLFQGMYVEGTIDVMDHATVVTDQVTVSNKAVWDGAQPKILITLKVSATIEEKQGKTNEDIIKKELEQLIANRFKKLFQTLQDNNSDALGLGRYFRNTLTEEQRKNWKPQLFPKLQCETVIDVDIRNNENLK